MSPGADIYLGGSSGADPVVYAIEPPSGALFVAFLLFRKSKGKYWIEVRGGRPSGGFTADAEPPLNSVQRTAADRDQQCSPTQDL